jgi:drug/metabolite transporter (DMT)-like permease
VRQRGFILILITSSLFGLGSVLAKLLGEAFNPFFVSWLSLLCGGFIVAGSQLARRKPLFPHLKRVAWIDIVLLASIGTALPLVCVVEGMAQTSAITGSFLLQAQGPAAIVLALFFLKEKMVWKQIAGIALLLVGSLLVIVRDLHDPLHIQGGQGDLLVLLAALGLGFSYIPGKRLAKHGDAFQIILLRLFIGSCLLLPFLPFQRYILLVPLTIALIGWLVLYIVTNFGVAYIFQQIGLGLLQAWESAALMQTLPLFGTLFALLMLHESLTPLQIVGGCVILLGGFLVI